MPDINSPLDGAAFEIAAPRSSLVVILAGIAILGIGSLGFYHGLTVGKPAGAGRQTAAASTIVGATPAVAMSQNPNWSTLNGPQMLPPPTAKAQVQDDDSDDSDTPDEASDAADQAPAPPPPPVAATVTPPAAAKSATPPAQPSDTAGMD